MALKINKKYKLFGYSDSRVGDYDTIRILNKFSGRYGFEEYTVEFLSTTKTSNAVFHYTIETEGKYVSRKITTFVKAVEDYVEPID